MKLFGWLLEPNVRGLEPDSSAMVNAHFDNMRRKPLARAAFKIFYNKFSDLVGPFMPSQSFLELGSGVGFIKDILPKMTTSDVREAPGIDLKIDAEEMAVGSTSIDAIFAINVFHHLGNPEKFWAELDRVLKPGGLCVLVEPANTPLSRVIHSRLHSDEYFDLSEPLDHSRVVGPMSGANQAKIHISLRNQNTPWRRGNIELERRFLADNFLTFLVSGGLNFRPLLPGFMAGPLRSIERILLRPCHGVLALHEYFVFRKVL